MRNPFFGQAPKTFRLLRFLYHLPSFIKLAWRLFLDSRVPIHRKAILVIVELLAVAFAVAYFVFPFDFDFHILGKFDDLLVGVFVILVPGTWLFIKLCPDYVVSEHVDQISKGV